MLQVKNTLLIVCDKEHFVLFTNIIFSVFTVTSCVSFLEIFNNNYLYKNRIIPNNVKILKHCTFRCQMSLYNTSKQSVQCHNFDYNQISFCFCHFVSFNWAVFLMRTIQSSWQKQRNSCSCSQVTSACKLPISKTFSGTDLDRIQGVWLDPLN